MSATRAPAAIRTAVVLTHSDAADTDRAMRAVLDAAERASCELLLPQEEAEKHGDVARAGSVVDGLPERPDLCLVLGGDGTLLRGLRAYAGTGVPVFGINFGRIGFLTTVERDDLEDGLERAFTGDFEVMHLPGLRSTVAAEQPLAINDISFTRRPHGPVAELSYSISGEEVGHVRCDGLVAATPAGSTGYNLANQGPILAWGVEGYVVSFIAPHTLTARPLVVAPDDMLHVRNVGAREPVDVALDGMPAGTLACGDEVEIRFQNDLGSLAQVPGTSFYQRIRERFGGLAR